MAFCHHPGETAFFFAMERRFLVPDGHLKRKETKAELMKREGAVAVHMP